MNDTKPLPLECKKFIEEEAVRLCDIFDNFIRYKQNRNEPIQFNEKYDEDLKNLDMPKKDRIEMFKRWLNESYLLERDRLRGLVQQKQCLSMGDWFTACLVLEEDETNDYLEWENKNRPEWFTKDSFKERVMQIAEKTMKVTTAINELTLSSNEVKKVLDMLSRAAKKQQIAM